MPDACSSYAYKGRDGNYVMKTSGHSQYDILGSGVYCAHFV